MELLDEEFYDKLTNPLKQVSINCLFARSVIERKISGRVYVDHVENPKTFYVVHPYGMSLLFGDSQNTEFNNTFLQYSLNTNKIRNRHEWMQAYPADWHNVLTELYGNAMIKSAENKENKEEGIVELNTRCNFKFNRDKYFENRKTTWPQDCTVVQTNKKIYEEMTGSVVPASFWDTAEDFVTNGVGFSLLHHQNLAATAYSAFIHDNKLELGIETIPGFRGKGFAQLACSALIEYSLETGYEPIWACRLENVGSFKLAEKLGFEMYNEVPYYRLSK